MVIRQVTKSIHHECLYSGTKVAEEHEDGSSSSSSNSSGPTGHNNNNNKTNGTATTKKCVRFDPSRNVEHVNTFVCKEDLKLCHLWYTEMERYQIKEATKALAQEIYRKQQQQQRTGININNIIHNNNNDNNSYSMLLERAHQACCQTSHATNILHLPQQQQAKEQEVVEESKEEETAAVNALLSASERRQLEQWMSLTGSIHSNMGIEKWTIRPIGRDRTIRRRELMDTVLLMDFRRRSPQGQLVYPSSSSSLLLASKQHQQEQEEQLRQSCQAISRPSRLMARLLAETRAASFGY